MHLLSRISLQTWTGIGTLLSVIFGCLYLQYAATEDRAPVNGGASPYD